MLHEFAFIEFFSPRLPAIALFTDVIKVIKLIAIDSKPFLMCQIQAYW